MNYTNITTQTTTVVKSGRGTLKRVVINTPLANGVITLYDNTAGSGTKIGTITLPASLTSSGPLVADYDLLFLTGLTVVTGTANMNVTVVYG